MKFLAVLIIAVLGGLLAWQVIGAVKDIRKRIADKKAKKDKGDSDGQEK